MKILFWAVNGWSYTPYTVWMWSTILLPKIQWLGSMEAKHSADKIKTTSPQTFCLLDCFEVFLVDFDWHGDLKTLISERDLLAH